MFLAFFCKTCARSPGVAIIMPVQFLLQLSCQFSFYCNIHANVLFIAKIMPGRYPGTVLAGGDYLV
jgi:hypothetical protein